MKRWNGWGEIDREYPLPESAAAYLETLVGKGRTQPDASLQEVLSSVPPSRLEGHPEISTDPEERLRHARGQSLPDWVALRSGRIGAFPDGVAYPASDEDVRRLLEFAGQTGARLIPYGGGTSVVGHINPLPQGHPILTVDLSRLDQLLDLDTESRLATFEAGVNGPSLEAQLNPRGYTLGHYPQSFEQSTLGGWIATRSSGQQSYHYGRIEDLFAAGHLETLLGPLDLPPLPASAAGPDLRQMFLGSEGRFGFVTRATLRIQALPQAEAFYGAFFRDWEAGALAVREIVQAGVPVSMLRLSDAQETETTLALSGKDRLVGWARRGLSAIGYGSGRSLLVYGITGDQKTFDYARRRANGIIRQRGGLPAGGTIGKMWRKSRFFTPYLRNTLWDRGYALDTLETAVPWSSVQSTAADIQSALRGELEDLEERLLVFSHLSHVYADGASIYTTFLFRRGDDPEGTLRRWERLKSAASRVILAHGGTISHQHGVGRDHAPYLQAEKGRVGMAMLEAARKTLDPQGLLNPGKLLLDAEVNHVEQGMAG